MAIWHRRGSRPTPCPNSPDYYLLIVMFMYLILALWFIPTSVQCFIPSAGWRGNFGIRSSRDTQLGPQAAEETKPELCSKEKGRHHANHQFTPTSTHQHLFLVWTQSLPSTWMHTVLIQHWDRARTDITAWMPSYLASFLPSFFSISLSFNISLALFIFIPSYDVMQF